MTDAEIYAYRLRQQWIERIRPIRISFGTGIDPAAYRTHRQLGTIPGAFEYLDVLDYVNLALLQGAKGLRFDTTLDDNEAYFIVYTLIEWESIEDKLRRSR